MISDALLLNKAHGASTGGTSKKSSLARELEEDPEFLVGSPPTRGLDIGATQYVHDNIIKARDQGCAVLFDQCGF